MIRRKGPILAAGVVAAFALGWYRGLFGVGQDVPSPPGSETAQPQSGLGTESAPPVGAQADISASSSAASAEPTTENRQTAAGGEATPAQPLVATADPSVRAPPPAAEAAQAMPGFDIVRVEPDGSTVVAGKGAANERIALTDGNQTLGEAQTDANGDFVMTLSLPTGSHRLQLAQREDVLSDDAAVVNVPPPGRPDQLLVMMQRPASRARSSRSLPSRRSQRHPARYPKRRPPRVSPWRDRGRRADAIARLAASGRECRRTRRVGRGGRDRRRTAVRRRIGPVGLCGAHLS